jgi:MraZ protein
MSSFKGQYRYSVDSKGRINLPAKLRKNISPGASENFVITRGIETCLFLYPQDEWNKVEISLRTLNSFDPTHRFFVRTMLQWASDVDIDNQARIAIPRNLM